MCSVFTWIIICLFYGTTVAQRNLSPFGNATQSTTYKNYNASLAITGGETTNFSTNSCSHTGDKTGGAPAWWMLNLPNDTIFIEQVIIFYRKGFEHRLDGYSLYLSNNSINGFKNHTPPGISCYKDRADGKAETIQKRGCNRMAKFIIIYNKHISERDETPFLELCDVQVIGCPKHRFGENCSSICSSKCFDNHCYGNGSCVWGCNCFDNNCDGNETCTTGCKDGFIGQHCNESCLFRTFGKKCSYQCHCKNQTTKCDPVNGKCSIKGCEKGWHGENCSTECPVGTFGFDCLGNCSHCFNNTCDRVSGECRFNDCGILQIDDSCIQPARQLDDSSSSAGTIAVVAFVAIIIAGLVMVFVIFITRKRRLKKRNLSHIILSKSQEICANDTSRQKDPEYVNVRPHSSNYESVEDINDNKDTIPEIINPNDEDVDNYRQKDAYTVYNNIKSKDKVAKHKVAIDEIAAYINEKLKENKFESDFESLPKGHIHPHTEGKKEINKVKNRFLTTWPYDHSRVILKENKSCDYINASFIDNYSKEKAYIATQGPKRNTIDDFWEMIWQEDVRVIVMVTPLIETNRIKCAQYWPDLNDKSLTVGDIRISMIKEKNRTVFVERIFTVSVKKEHTYRKIHHFHFTGWPDHDIPDITKLITFYRHVKRQAVHSERPIVVHCSAGIGRTGTFIAIDALYEHGQRTGFINVMEYAQIMRKDRMNMIQTKDQYQTVFEALLELFTVPETAYSRDDFRTMMQIKQDHHVPKNQTKLYLEFQKLQSLKPAFSSKNFSIASTNENRLKNSNDILAHDKYRPILMSTENDRSDYINAVIIPEFDAQTKIIVTQYPSEYTLVDFWTLVYDQDCSVVVMLEDQSKDNYLWPSTESTINFKLFTVQTIREDSSVISIKLTHKTNKEERPISIIYMYEWGSDHIPVSTKSMIDFLRKVTLTRESNPATLAVVDRDGASRSGLFVCLMLVQEKLKLDDEVDIFQVVRQLQTRRPEFMTKFEQYEFCYQCVKEFLSDDSLYANA